MRDDRSDDLSITGRDGQARRPPRKAAGFAAGLLGAVAVEAAGAEKGGSKPGRQQDKDAGGRDDGKGQKTPDEPDGNAGGLENGSKRQQSAQQAAADKGTGKEGGDGDGSTRREQRSARQDADDETPDGGERVTGRLSQNGGDGNGLADRIRADLEEAADRRRTAAEDLADRLRPAGGADDAADDDDPVDIDLAIADDGDVTVDVALNVPGLDGPPSVDVNIPDLPGFDDEDGDPDGGDGFAFSS